MNPILKTGDLVIQKRDVEDSIYNSCWYRATYGEVQIVDRAGEPNIEEDNDQCVFLKHNTYIWSNKWLEKIEPDFLHKKEFEL